MLLGIVADIHEDVDNLRRALSAFRSGGVQRVVNLGDACDTFSAAGRSLETVKEVSAAEAIGVWGNHDVGLCLKSEADGDLLNRAAPEVLEFMSGMKAQLVIENCRFSHIEPWLDPARIEDLWYFDGVPDTLEKAGRSFSAVAERVLFLGHFHCWLAMTRTERLNWNGDRPLQLTEGERYLIVVAPVVAGWCAIFDTEQSLLTPCRIQ